MQTRPTFLYSLFVFPPKVVALCGCGWALRCSASRDRNDHQPPGYPMSVA